MTKEINTDRFREGIQIRQRIVNEATGVDFITSTAGCRNSRTGLQKEDNAANRMPRLKASVPAEFDISEETEFQVVRTKHVAVKPMSEDEAILQMNLLGHDFFVYRNTDGVVSIVYRRRDGGYGLLETDGVEE